MFLLPSSSWKIVRSSGKGRGIVVTTELAPGTVVGDFLGKIIKEEEVEKYEKLYGLFGFSRNDQEVIWAFPNEKGVQLMNSSCVANCGFFPYQGHILIYTLRRIFAGEELSFFYHVEPPPRSVLSRVYSCNCGSEFCRGSLYSSPWFEAEWEKVMNRKEGKELRKKIVPYNGFLTPLKSYPKEMRDVPIFDLFGAKRKRPEVFDDRTLPPVKELRRRLRWTGKRLRFSKLGVVVVGVKNRVALVEPLGGL